MCSTLCILSFGIINHAQAILVSRPHYLPKDKDSIQATLCLKHSPYLLPQNICLGLIIKVGVLTHVYKTQNVCNCMASEVNASILSGFVVPYCTDNHKSLHTNMSLIFDFQNE